MFNGTVITKEGQSVLAYCIANELPIQFTYMKIGDGVLSTETEEELSDLISEQLAVLIEHKSCSDGIYMLRAVFTNQSLSQGFYIRECGVFVNNPETNKDVLFAYDNAGAGEDVDYFAPGNGKVILKEVFEMAASVGNDANVTLVINPSLVFITQEEFEEYKRKDIIIHGIQIEPTEWLNNQYTYEIPGITEDDLATIWFKAPEQAAECAIIAETVTCGIKFMCETVPESVISLSLEVKKI